MSLCQHGVQVGAGFECTACVTTAPSAFEQQIAEHGQRLAAEAAPVAPVEERTEEDDDVQAALVTLRAYLEDLQDGFLQSEASAIFEALGKVEQHIRGEQK